MFFLNPQTWQNSRSPCQTSTAGMSPWEGTWRSAWADSRRLWSRDRRPDREQRSWGAGWVTRSTAWSRGRRPPPPNPRRCEPRPRRTRWKWAGNKVWVILIWSGKKKHLWIRIRQNSLLMFMFVHVFFFLLLLLVLHRPCCRSWQSILGRWRSWRARWGNWSLRILILLKQTGGGNSCRRSVGAANTPVNKPIRADWVVGGHGGQEVTEFTLPSLRGFCPEII